MYEAFDAFLRLDTWHSRHPADLQRFHEALRRVIHEHGFNPDEFGQYMVRKRGSGENSLSNLSEEAFEKARSRYVDDAWAVYYYEHLRQ